MSVAKSSNKYINNGLAWKSRYIAKANFIIFEILCTKVKEKPLVTRKTGKMRDWKRESRGGGERESKIRKRANEFE